MARLFDGQRHIWNHQAIKQSNHHFYAFNQSNPSTEGKLRRFH